MIEDIPNQLISWHSLPNAEVQNQGSVEFKRVPGGTELFFKASYAVPGAVGSNLKMFRYITEKQLKKELYQFKNMIESGEMLRAA